MMEPPAALRGVLQDDEALLWHGKPNPLYAARAGLAVSVFGLVWTLLLLGAPSDGPILINDIAIHDPLARQAIMVQFHAAGIAMMLAAPFALFMARSTWYVVSDARMLVVKRFPVWGSVQTLLPSRVRRTERRGKTSQTALGRLLLLRRAPRRSRAAYADIVTEFEAIRDAGAAQAAVDRLLATPAPLCRRCTVPTPPPAHLAAFFATMLHQGERLLWAAQPVRRHYVLATLAPVFLILLFLAPILLAVASGDLDDVLVFAYALFLVSAPLLAWLRAPFIAFAITTDRVIRVDRTPILGGETVWYLAIVESIERTLPEEDMATIVLRDGNRLDTETRPARLVLRALPDIAAAEAALHLALCRARDGATMSAMQEPLA